MDLMSIPRLQLDFETSWSTYLGDDVNRPLGRAEDVAVIDSLLAVADRYDAMLLDGFGVLNCGEAAISGMPEMWRALQARGVTLLILSNGATGQTADAVQKYRALDFPVSADDILTSRDATRVGLESFSAQHPDWCWGVSPMGGRKLDDLPGRFQSLERDADWDDVDGFLLVTTLHWTARHTELLEAALRRRARPVWVANPDVTAPFPHHFSLEPGHVARGVASLPGVDVSWFGKPHANVYDLALSRLRARLPDLKRERVLMVGDSPHTDILGARNYGLHSCLTLDFGLLRGQPLGQRLAECGIWPQYLMTSDAGVWSAQ